MCSSDLVKPGAVCELRVRETLTGEERLRARLAEKLSVLEGDNGKKSEVFDALCACRDEKEWRKALEESGLPARYRKYLRDGLWMD